MDAYASELFVMFEPVDLEFEGRRYTVPAHSVWGLIAAVEQHCALSSLAIMAQSGNFRRTTIVSALHAALRYAGCDKTIEEVNGKVGFESLLGWAQSLQEILLLAEPDEKIDVPEKKREKKKRQAS